MIIQNKKGNIQTYCQSNKLIDLLPFEWYETSKRIQRKTSKAGIELSLKFLGADPAITEGDILYEDETRLIVATILKCECIVITPSNMLEMANVCYEIGNKHLPLFYEAETLLIPFDAPLYKMLASMNLVVKKESRKLLSRVTTTVAAHGHQATGNTLLSRILKLTTDNE